jgi:hypothetical protein
METLKQYLNLGIKLIPVYDDNRFVKDYNNPNSKTKDWGTDDIAEIQSLVSGNGYRDGLGKGSKIKLFRFYPSDYGLVVIDIDMHTAEGGKLKGNGLKNWRKIEAELNLPMNCRIKSHPCYVRTPSNGYHLYYRAEKTLDFNSTIAESVEIFHGKKAVNVAGSVKEGKEYKLIGNINKDTIPDLPDELKELMLKPIQKEQPQIIRISSSRNSNNEDKDIISEEERKKYKPYVREYLIANGEKINNNSTNCPCHEDDDPSAQVNKDSLHCHKTDNTYDVYEIAKLIKGIVSFKEAFADVKNTIDRIKKWTKNRLKKS